MNFNPNYTMHIFCFISKGQILREFQNIEKFLIYGENYDFTKGMNSYSVSNAVLHHNSSKKKLDL